MIADAVKRAFMKKRKGGWSNWPTMVWAIDLHDVIIPSSYNKDESTFIFAPLAEEVLQWLTNRDDMTLVLYTCSYDEHVIKVRSWMKEHEIVFRYINENPDAKSDGLRNLKGKFYYDVMLEDKAGFDMNTDWKNIKDVLMELGEWENKFYHK